MKSNILSVVGLFLFLVFSSCKSKEVQFKDTMPDYIPYYLKVYDADSLFLSSNYNESYNILDSLFKKHLPINAEGYYEYSNYIISSIMTGRTKDIKNKIKYAYENFYGIGMMHMEYSKIGDSLNKYQNLFDKKEIEGFKEIYKKKIDFSLRNQITMMVGKDQDIRNQSVINIDSIINLRQKQEPIIKEIFSKVGYPARKIIGRIDLDGKQDDFNLLLLHSDNSFKKNVLPFLLDEVKKGKYSPQDYAMIYDKSLQDLKIQYYGEFRKNETELVDLINAKDIDSIRKTIGLPKLSYVFWKEKYIKRMIAKMQSEY